MESASPPTFNDLVEVWWSSVEDFIFVLESLGPADWSRPTDLPGWDVKAIAAHVANLESLISGGPEETAEVAPAPHLTSPSSMFTEIGVINRRSVAPGDIIAEIRTVTARRNDVLRSTPGELSDPAPSWMGAIGWTLNDVMLNRPLDVWMHEQDIRRAVGKPGNLFSPAADHSVRRMLGAFGLVVGKKVKPPVGTTAVIAVTDSVPVAVEVGSDGRARFVDEPRNPTVRIELDRASYIVLAGGRRDPITPVIVTGDQVLGQQIIAKLATTP